jgi:hypothetical protein
MTILDLNVGDRFCFIGYDNRHTYLLKWRHNDGRIEIWNEFKKESVRMMKSGYAASCSPILLLEEAYTEIEWIAEKKTNNQ